MAMKTASRAARQRATIPTPTEPDLRSLDFGNVRVSGTSQDASAGTKAKAMFYEIHGDEEAIKRVRVAYDKVCKATEGMSKVEVRACLFAAASDYTLDSIIAKSRHRQWGPKIGERDQARIDAIRGQLGPEQAETFRKLLLVGKMSARVIRRD